MAGVAANQVRTRREGRGLSQLTLAERARLTRQSLGAIEAGRATPSVDVALRLARALDCHVEELFGGEPSEQALATESSGGRVSGRVALAHIAGRWVSYPLSEDGVRRSADGVVVTSRARAAEVAPLRSPLEARDNVVLMGCAAGLGLLADRLNSRPGPGRFLWLARSSTAALAALAARETHVAGAHLTDERAGEANVAAVRRLASTEPLVLVTLARWEAGLVLRPEDAERVRGAADLAQPDLRLVAREAGAGAQRLLERALRGAGLPVGRAREALLRVGGHLEVARVVGLGVADVGVATRDAALAFGLAFVPLAEERVDLALPLAALSEPRMVRLFDVLVSGEFRRELSVLGYDVRASGERVAEVGAA